MIANATIEYGDRATAAMSELRHISPSGWRSGARNLVRKETYTWLRTRFGLIQLVLWVLIINGLMVPIINDAGTDAGVDQTAMDVAISSYIQVVSWFTPIGVAVLAMSAIVGEKNSGTAAWVLSAPVSRAGFLLSKLSVLGLGAIATMVVVPGVIGFLELTNLSGTAGTGVLSLLPWATANGALALGLLFYIALTLFLGTIFDSRGAVVGITLGVLFCGIFLGGMLPQFVFNLTPWAMFSQLAVELATDSKEVTSVVPVFATLAWIAALTGFSFWRFQREEF